jgi:hypothetical protein
VDDVYEDNEPNLVCYAHIAADTNDEYELDDEGDEPMFVTEACSMWTPNPFLFSSTKTM